MTQLSKAKFGEITREMEIIAKEESIDEKTLAENIKEGKTVIPNSELRRNIKPVGIGFGLRTKINANIGSSPAKADLNFELEKLKTAIKYGADAVMDLSTGGDIDNIRREIIKNSTIPVGTVPIYQSVCKKDSIVDLTEDDFFKGIKKHIEDGVDFITVHCGITKDSLKLLKKRLMGVVSRGGSFIIKWMEHNEKENPLYENFDKLLFLAKKHDVTLSLGDGLRPGCIKDATDKAQLEELKKLGKLAKKAYEEDVQVIIEGPGHVPLNQIEMNVKLEKEYCNKAPFYVLGPLVTDIAPGYDHITSAIGSALAAMYGADFLCYVSPAEHLGLPDIEDVRQGVIASKIAAHSADIAKGIKNAQNWDNELSKARVELDWGKQMKLSIDPEKAKEIRDKCKVSDPDVCSMCGKYCSIKIGKELKK